MKPITIYPVLSIIILLSPLLLAKENSNGWDDWKSACEYDDKGDYENAILHYDRAIELLKKSGEAIPYYFYSSAGYLTWTRFDDYKRALGYFLEIYNGDYSAEDKDKPLKEIAYLYYLCHEYDEFIRYSDEYFKKGTNEDRKRLLHDLLANYYYDLGEVEKALSSARQVGKDFWITKNLQERNVIVSFKFRFRELMQNYHKRIMDSQTFFIEVPLDTYYQKLVSVKSTPQFKRIVKKERMNWLEFDFSKSLPEILEIGCTVNIRIISRSPVHAKQYTKMNDETGYYAHEKRRRHELEYDLDNPVLVDAVNSITKDKKTMYEKIKALSGWIDTNIPHTETLERFIKEGKRKAGTIPDIGQYRKLSDILINAAGDCVMRPGLFVGMCRILKIPARVLLVFVYHQYESNPGGFLNGAHGLCEVYDPVQKEWIQTDLMPEERLWSNHHYSIICEYYTKEDKPENYLNLMFLTQDAIKMGDAECARWKVIFVD